MLQQVTNGRRPYEVSTTPTIQRGIPIPVAERLITLRKPVWRPFLLNLQPGDSFWVKKTTATVVYKRAKEITAEAGWVFESRAEGEGRRFWRTK